MADEKDGNWHDFFAVWPVTVDAYTPEEIRNGRTSYNVCLCWVQRRWDQWIDHDLDDEPHASWRYRLKAKS